MSQQRDVEQLATGRTGSMFAQDLRDHAAELRDRVGGGRVAVIGAAGSIGGAVVRSILPLRPRALALFDLSENNLVELVRDLRSGGDVSVPDDFSALPIGIGSPQFTRYLREQPAFDYILNLAAMKHVRSEKDVYCLSRMIDTNVLFPSQLVGDLPAPCRKYFCVSSDKAANPANLMGATKTLMEKVLLMNAARQPFSTARFANVSFSDGSLPHGFLLRMQKGQPLSAPSDVKRYFMSHEEAGQICALSCFLGENRDIFFPKLEEQLNERTFAEIADGLLRQRGYEPVPCASEAEARDRAAELIPQKKWPVYYFTSDTTGEKAFEEFFVEGETVDVKRFRGIGVIPQSAADVDAPAVQRFLDFATDARTRGGVSKADYVREIRLAVPTLVHVETGKNLDQKM
jgi:FlaA1/EpsC-like NDP-sugar epimerase